MIFYISNKNVKDSNRLLFLFLKSKEDFLNSSQRETYAKELEKELKDFYFKMPPISLSANSFAKEIGVSHYKVIKWIEKGLLPATKSRAGHYLINLKEAESFLLERGFFSHFQCIKKPFLL